MHARQTPSGLEIILSNPAAWADGIPFHPVPADQQPLIDRNWVCVDGVFAPPSDTYLAEQAQQQFERARAQRLAQARAAVDAAARALVAHISATEQQTWPTQLAEAQAVQIWRHTPELLPNGTAPLLHVMVAARGYGESVFDLADRVLAAAAQYTAAAGPLVAWGQRTERALNAAQTLDELNAISLTPPPTQPPATAPEPVASQPE